MRLYSSPKAHRTKTMLQVAFPNPGLGTPSCAIASPANEALAGPGRKVQHFLVSTPVCPELCQATLDPDNLTVTHHGQYPERFPEPKLSCSRPPHRKCLRWLPSLLENLSDKHTRAIAWSVAEQVESQSFQGLTPVRVEGYIHPSRCPVKRVSAGCIPQARILS